MGPLRFFLLRVLSSNIPQFVFILGFLKIFAFHVKRISTKTFFLRVFPEAFYYLNQNSFTFSCSNLLKKVFNLSKLFRNAKAFFSSNKICFSRGRCLFFSRRSPLECFTTYVDLSVVVSVSLVRVT